MSEQTERCNSIVIVLFIEFSYLHFPAMLPNTSIDQNGQVECSAHVENVIPDLTRILIQGEILVSGGVLLVLLVLLADDSLS